MDILKYYYLTVVIILSTFLGSSKAIPDDGDTTNAGTTAPPNPAPTLPPDTSTSPAASSKNSSATNSSSSASLAANSSSPSSSNSSSGANASTSVGSSPKGSPAAPAPLNTNGLGPSFPPKQIVLTAPPTISPKEIAMEEKFAELKVEQCMMLFADCWVLIKMTKKYLGDETRLKICLKRVNGYIMCTFMTSELASEAKDEIEAQLKIAWEEAEKNKKKMKARKIHEERKQKKRNAMGQTA